ncbi:hypothetical protein [Streptomyces sp. NPDC037389]|uniref:hypothetical protein n=1 Tax=Streptomyces sp. NPDC037389 TaxID=3155369 RepID=UPI0033EAE82E
MRRIASVFLGTVALLGVLATPASAADAASTTVASVVATVQNAVTGVETAVGNLTGGL